MKKILSLILACVMCFSVMSVSAFADTQTSDGLFGVILDADGNVVERLVMPRDIYVDSVHTIPAGGSYISYQYEPRESFVFGFFTYDKNGTNITESNSKFEYSIWASNSIGDNKIEICFGGFQNSTSNNGKGYLEASRNNYGFKYFNGEITNQTQHATTVRIVVALNQDPSTIFG